MDENRQAELQKFFIFVMSHGIISWAKAAEVMGISLSDFHVTYGGIVNEEMERLYGWEDEQNQRNEP